MAKMATFISKTTQSHPLPDPGIASTSAAMELNPSTPPHEAFSQKTFANCDIITVHIPLSTIMPSASTDNTVEVEIPRLFDRSVIELQVLQHRSSKKNKKSSIFQKNRAQKQKHDLRETLLKLPHNIATDISDSTLQVGTQNASLFLVTSKAESTRFVLLEAIKDVKQKPENQSSELQGNLTNLKAQIGQFNKDTMEAIYHAMLQKGKHKQENKYTLCEHTSQKTSASKKDGDKKLPPKDAFWVKASYVRDYPNRYPVHRNVDIACNYGSTAVAGIAGIIADLFLPSDVDIGSVVSISLEDAEIRRRFYQPLGLYYQHNINRSDSLFEFTRWYGSDDNLDNLKSAGLGYTYGAITLVSKSKSLALGAIVTASALFINNPLFKAIVGGIFNKLYHACKKKEQPQSEPIKISSSQTLVSKDSTKDSDSDNGNLEEVVSQF